MQGERMLYHGLIFTVLVSVQAAGPGPPVIAAEGSVTFSAVRTHAVTLPCNLTASPPSQKVRWYKNGDLVVNTSVPRFSGASPQTPALTIRNLTEEDEGFYLCSATNRLGTAFGTSLTVTVLVEDCGENKTGIGCWWNCSHCPKGTICNPHTDQCSEYQPEVTSYDNVLPNAKKIDDVKLYAAIALFITGPGIIILIICISIMIKYFTAKDPGFLPSLHYQSAANAFPNFESRSIGPASVCEGKDPTSATFISGSTTLPAIGSGTNAHLEPQSAILLEFPGSPGQVPEEKIATVEKGQEISLDGQWEHSSHDGAKKQSVSGQADGFSGAERHQNGKDNARVSEDTTGATVASTVQQSKDAQDSNEAVDLPLLQVSPEANGQQQPAGLSGDQHVSNPQEQFANSSSRQELSALPTPQILKEIWGYLNFRLSRGKRDPSLTVESAPWTEMGATQASTGQEECPQLPS